MGDNNRVKVKLFVDKEKSRVVLAESDEQFVDILFSFLTMPLGTVIRILGKNASSLGSFANIYESVSNLDSNYFQTEACKVMLLRPRNTSEVYCEDLAINIDDTEPRTIYTCQQCSAKKVYFYSSVQNTHCSCGRIMSHATKWERTDLMSDKWNGVFVKGGLKFVISDNLNISMASTTVLLTLLKTLSIEDGSMLEERTVDLCPEQIVTLLWRSLISKSPLTDLLFNQLDTEDADQNQENMILPKAESDANSNLLEKHIKLVHTRSFSKCLYAEAEAEIVDILFSLLTFPLGLLIKHCNYLFKGCVVNIYRSVEGNSYFKSDECKSMLLSPMLATFHSCSSQMLNVEEITSKTRTVPGCVEQYYEPNIRGYKPRLLEFKERNPKYPDNLTERGGRFVKDLGKFMVTNNLHVNPLCVFSAVQKMNEFKVSASDLVESEAYIGVTQVLGLIRVSFLSKTVLSDVFAPGKLQSKKK